MESLANTLPKGHGDRQHHRGARRGSARYPLHADIELVGDPEGTGVAINASAGGMRIAIDRALTVGTVYSLRVRTPNRTTDEQLRVVWTRQLPDGWLVGLQFASLN